MYVIISWGSNYTYGIGKVWDEKQVSVLYAMLISLVNIQHLESM